MIFDFLWTDVCFLTLLVLSVIFILNSVRKQHIRRSFALILSKPSALCAGMVLILFISIAVLDSIHYKANESLGESSQTLLDSLVAPIGKTFEKTYSAPLALTQFVSESEIINGVVQQIHPRLNYPPVSIQTKSDKTAVIMASIKKAGLVTILVSFSFWFFLVLIQWIQKSYRPLVISSNKLTVLMTLTLLVFFIVLSYSLSRSFHLLGTGQIGQDMFYFTLKSIRTGLVIGFLTTFFMLPLALFLGIGAGYFGGIVDDVIQYIYTTLSSIPGVLLITASVLSLQTYISSHPDQFSTLAQSADARLLALCLILGVTSWTSLCRLLRAETLKLREVDFVLAAKALGSNWFTIIRKHLLPNVLHIVVITLVLDFSFLVLAEAVLSYVGVGVSPMTISWGNMINGARLELSRDPIIWWPMLAAFLFMFLLVLAVNLFADAVRDAFDPHQSHL